jgi:hypothetical protein
MSVNDKVSGCARVHAYHARMPSRRGRPETARSPHILPAPSCSPTMYRRYYVHIPLYGTSGIWEAGG